MSPGALFTQEKLCSLGALIFVQLDTKWPPSSAEWSERLERRSGWQGLSSEVSGGWKADLANVLFAVILRRTKNPNQIGGQPLQWFWPSSFIQAQWTLVPNNESETLKECVSFRVFLERRPHLHVLNSENTKGWTHLVFLSLCYLTSPATTFLPSRDSQLYKYFVCAWKRF